jgi:hypothetical protein
MKRFELSTLSLARRCSTTELHPQDDRRGRRHRQLHCRPSHHALSGPPLGNPLGGSLSTCGPPHLGLHPMDREQQEVEVTRGLGTDRSSPGTAPGHWRTTPPEAQRVRGTRFRPVAVGLDASAAVGAARRASFKTHLRDGMVACCVTARRCGAPSMKPPPAQRISSPRPPTPPMPGGRSRPCVSCWRPSSVMGGWSRRMGGMPTARTAEVSGGRAAPRFKPAETRSPALWEEAQRYREHIGVQILGTLRSLAIHALGLAGIWSITESSPPRLITAKGCAG